jgi:hypothetical protein
MKGKRELIEEYVIMTEIVCNACYVKYTKSEGIEMK